MKSLNFDWRVNARFCYQNDRLFVFEYPQTDPILLDSPMTSIVRSCRTAVDCKKEIELNYFNRLKTT